MNTYLHPTENSQCHVRVLYAYYIWRGGGYPPKNLEEKRDGEGFFYAIESIDQDNQVRSNINRK